MIVSDAAHLGGVKPITIYQNIYRGRLTGRRYLGRIVVAVDEVARLWPWMLVAAEEAAAAPESSLLRKRH